MKGLKAENLRKNVLKHGRNSSARKTHLLHADENFDCRAPISDKDRVVRRTHYRPLRMGKLPPEHIPEGALGAKVRIRYPAKTARQPGAWCERPARYRAGFVKPHGQ